MSDTPARHRLIRLASTLPKGSTERGEILSILAADADHLKKHQFTPEDNPNPKGNDKDGDGETNEPSPVKDKKAAPCDDAPAPFKEQCLKKVEEGKKNEDKKEAGGGCDSPKLPDALKAQCKEKEKEGDKEAKEKYPWDDCIADQMKEYGSKEIAEKVCGKIRAESQGLKSAADFRRSLIRMAAEMPKGDASRKKLLTLLKS